jgi:hypothetical protein
MRPLLVTPVAVLALVVLPAQIYPITGPEAVTAITRQIHKQVHARLRAGFRSESHCTGLEVGQQEVTATTQLAQWRCELVLHGVRFPGPCNAEAKVFATDRPNHPRIQWLHESKYCHERRLSSRRS